MSQDASEGGKVATIFSRINNDNRHEARMFWERTYETAVAQSLYNERTTVKQAEWALAQTVAETAAMIADKALQHWLDRW